jgi:CheY-like chemotaxis protein
MMQGSTTKWKKGPTTMTKRPNLSQGSPGVVSDEAQREARPKIDRSATSSDALTRLANDIAHDFNNLITSILANAEALTSRFDDGRGGPDELSSIRGEAQRAAAILRRLTAVSEETLLAEPVVSDVPQWAARRAQPVREGAAVRVLLAEDDVAVRRVACLALKKAGYEVTACATGEEAWEVFCKTPHGFDLLVTDLSMPALDGASLIQRVRLLHPRLRALLISGYCNDRQAFDLVRSGAVAFLPKPFNTHELLSSVRGQLEAA